MTKTAIKNAFRKLDAAEQAEVLTELAASLAKALSDEDVHDARVFDKRQRQEPKARSWSEVRERGNTRHGRKRSPSR